MKVHLGWVHRDAHVIEVAIESAVKGVDRFGSFRVAVVGGGVAAGSRWSARSGARTNDLEAVVVLPQSDG